MRHRDVVAVDRIDRSRAHGIDGQMRDELMAVEVEVDPPVGAAAFAAAEQLTVKPSRGGEVVDGKGQMKWRQAHRADMSLRAQRRNPASFGLLRKTIFR
jgi:hypothetical protein